MSRAEQDPRAKAAEEKLDRLDRVTRQFRDEITRRFKDPDGDIEIIAAELVLWARAHGLYLSEAGAVRPDANWRERRTGRPPSEEFQDALAAMKARNAGSGEQP